MHKGGGEVEPWVGVVAGLRQVCGRLHGCASDSNAHTHLLRDHVELESELGDHNASCRCRCIGGLSPQHRVARGGVDVIRDGHCDHAAGPGCRGLGTACKHGSGAQRSESQGECSGHSAVCEGPCTEPSTCLNVKPPELSRKVPLVDWPGPQKPVCGAHERTVHTSPQCSTGITETRSRI